MLATLAIYKLAIRRLGARPRDDLPVKGALGDTSLGIGVGGAVFAVVVGLAAVLGVYRIQGAGTLENAVPFLMMGGVVAGFVEEVIFRGIIFRWVEEFGGSWLALLVSSVLFGIAHGMNDGATWFSSLAVAVEAGVLLGGAYMLTRSLWLAIGIHAGWNLSQGLIFDVPVSGFPVEGAVEAVLDGPDLLTGGTFGLEASVLALVVAGSAGAWLVWQARKEGKLMPPMWRR
ncbi:CPBP family intramembrane metalloprotease [Leptolyngbya sp. 15MV]|nr:CPBP family intramembrane metalloprotease [Leptolyngbya sp. 15MV]